MRGSPVLTTARQHATTRHLVVCAVTGLTLTLAACGSDAEPASLQLGSQSTSNVEALAADSVRSPAGVPTPTPGTSWPPTPVDGPVLTPSNAGVSTARVQALANALGITAPILERPGGWVTPSAGSSSTTSTSDVPRLIVLKDPRGTWTFGVGTSCDLEQPITDSGTCTTSSVAVPGAAVAPPATGTASGSGNGSTSRPAPDDRAPDAPDATGAPAEPATPPSDGVTAPTPADQPTVTTPAFVPAPTVDQVNTLAAPVLTAAGISSDAGLTYSPAAAQDDAQGSRTVTADPVVSGLPTTGAGTSVSVEAVAGGPRITFASGSLGTWVLKDTYGVIGATEGLKRLAELPQPAIAELCPVTPDGTGCAPRPTPTIVGARFGLMADTDGTAPVLAPAWLYSTRTVETVGNAKGTEYEGLVAVSAVQDRYLAPVPTGTSPVATDDPGSVPPGAVPGSVGTGGSEPGSADPGSAGVPEPLPLEPT